LVRVHCVGICNTDLELVRGYYPYVGVPGHEFTGRVEAAPGGEEWIGRRVVGEISAVCHRCPACRAGRGSHCRNRTVLGISGRDGAMAEHLVLPLENLHAIPDGLADETAVFTEPTAAALQIQEQLSIGPGQRVQVIGAGKLGHLVAQTLALTGCDLLVLGRNAARLGLLAGRGIDTDTVDRLKEDEADLVVECTGNPEGFELARKAVRPGGTIVLKSTYRGLVPVPLAPLVVDEITVVGSRCGPFRPAIELLAAGRIDAASLVAERFPLCRGVEAFDRAAEPGVMKVLLDVAG
jgi:threonine dehydrogenase-like Zn-dependent dehydrogenase